MKPTDVDEYLTAQPAEHRAALALVRAACLRGMPGAQEGISYGMPTFRLGGRSVLHFAGWTRHYALYPTSDAVSELLAGSGVPHVIEKGTIRFPWTAPVPEDVIEQVARLRAAEESAG